MNQKDKKEQQFSKSLAKMRAFFFTNSLQIFFMEILRMFLISFEEEKKIS